MTTDRDQGGIRVELYVRSLAPRAGRRQQNSVIDRLEDLESAGRIDEFTVDVWGRQVGLSSVSARTGAGQFVLDRVASFREWADETGRSVASFFETRRVDSRVTGDKYTALVLPSLTLAEFRDGELAHVAPCSDGDEVTTVADRVEALAANGGTISDPADERTRVPAEIEEE
ncbi:HTH domain-containing protein [Halorientalis marina]|uniref:HTH domain-containing protein n=1 Tax=Halorientalis marina TaxID=2931976 RepID=UPI001FF27628|nr:HTH domain-containing protein [Halorientalis marina]